MLQELQVFGIPMDAQAVQEELHTQLDPSQRSPAVQVVQVAEVLQSTQLRGHAIQVLLPDKEKPGSQPEHVVIRA